MRSDESPYRIAASPPEAPETPRRRLALYGNLAITALVVVSLGMALGFGCTPRHLDEPAAITGGVVTVVAILAIAVWSIGVLIRNVSRRDSAKPKLDLVSALGIAFTGMHAIVGSVLGFVFWLGSAQSPASFGFGGWGRPLRIGKRALTPDVRASTEWARGPRPDPATLDPVTRAVLRDLWLHDARKEHASVPAFGQVARQLIVLGAPSDLVRRAHRSCLQEIDHAERCFALASGYAGQDLGVQPMPALAQAAAELPFDRTAALVQVATESLVDGALLEDFNAELARTALDDVQDHAARETLLRIVDDESEHARLAWDIVEYCLREGGERVATALARTFAGVEAEVRSLYEPELEARVAALADLAPLYAHGRVRRDRVEVVYRARRRVLETKLETLLASRVASRAA